MTDADAPADESAEPSREAAAPAKPAAGPAAPLPQWRVNAMVWLPFLQNPAERTACVKYGARDKREGGTWRISLPQQCWQCRSKDGLQSKKFSKQLRCFEFPLPIAGISAGAALLQLLVLVMGPFKGAWTWWLLLTAPLTLAAGAAVLFLKSWQDEVKLTMYTCPTCAGALREPGVAVDAEDLYLFVGSAQLAEAARAELKAERRGKGKHGGGEPPPSEPSNADESPDVPKKKKKKREDGEGAPAAPPKPAGPRIQELPPIPLDDQ